jgi:type IV secretory pathway VirB2 component (pilin)
MGRSRRRARATGVAAPAPAASRPPIVAPQELRKSLGAYLAGAIAIAILVLIGTVTLAGSLAPWLVLILDAAASFALFKWSESRLAGLALSDEDRMLQTLAGGLLAVVLLFAAVAAVVLTVA